MCGIFCYIGSEMKTTELIKGLKKLEYRGYDSWGVFAKRENGDEYLFKEVGHNIKIDEFNTSILLGHSRWSTTGRVTKENAHPIKSGLVTIVHNGILENYIELKEILVKSGYNFETETDTEVIAACINNMVTKTFLEAVNESIKLFKGNMAFVVTNGVDLIAFRRNTPLVLGVVDDGYFISSDVQSFLSFTNKVIYLDNSVTKIDKNLKIQSTSQLEAEIIDSKIEITGKNDFDHFMIKEIMEQIDIFKKIDELDIKQLKKERFILIGCGSSYHAALFGERILRQVGIDATAKQASEYIKLPGDRVIALTQSGETIDVLNALENTVNPIIITNNQTSLVAKKYNSIITNVGLERSVAATKTFTAQLAVLMKLAGFELEPVFNNFFKLVTKSSRKFIKEVAEIILKGYPIIIGNELSYPLALEGALKIKEVSYLHSEAINGTELKHGPIALIEEGSIVIVLESNGIDKIIDELKARGAFVIYIGTKKKGDVFIKVLNQISQIIPLQLLAYELAVLKGVNPDYPKNLAKSVTV